MLKERFIVRFMSNGKYIETWKLCGHTSEDEYRANDNFSFENMIRQVVESENPEKLDVIEMAKQSTKIDFAKGVN